jgi:SlyX protein
MEERLEKIEMKLAYLEDFLLRLQTEVVARNTAMDRLEEEHEAMKERLVQLVRNSEEDPQAMAHDRKPPHY